MRSVTIGLAILAVGVGVRQCLSDVVSLLPAADTTLNAFDPDNNMGGHDRVLAGTANNGTHRRGLFKFDVASNITPGGTINTATLTLSVPEGTDDVDSTFDLFRLLVDWGEGTKIGERGSAATAGEATWNHRFLDTNAWSAPGGLAGTDYASPASSSTLVQSFGLYDWAGLADDVQFWLDNPASNFGWILISQSEGINGTARRFGALHAELDAPVLKIKFTPVPEPTTFALLILGGVLMLKRSGGSVSTRSLTQGGWG